MLLDFSEDEWLFIVLAAGASMYGMLKWYAPLLRVRLPCGNFRWLLRLVLILLPLGALAGLYAVLQRWSDPVHVIGHLDYIVLFMIGGGAWFVGTIAWLSLVGLSARDDAIERGNPIT